MEWLYISYDLMNYLKFDVPLLIFLPSQPKENRGKKKKKTLELVGFTMFKPSLLTLSHQEMDDVEFLIC